MTLEDLYRYYLTKTPRGKREFESVMAMVGENRWEPHHTPIPIYPQTTRVAHAQKCPICHGTGKILADDKYMRYPRQEVICHGCGGRGWVVVR